MAMFQRFFPVVAVAVFLAVGFGWRSWLQWKRFGTSGVILFRASRPLQVVRDLLFLMQIVICLGQAVVAAVSPGTLMPWTLDLPAGCIVAGTLLSTVGIVFMVLAQLHLGRSWRIGIDEKARPGLITGGLYRYSRNPIFLGMFTMLAGLALVLPTSLSAILLLTAMACVRSQVLEEERYLTRVYGPEYRAYARRVGRFVPALGRFA